jgi:hypothetical protein
MATNFTMVYSSAAEFEDKGARHKLNLEALTAGPNFQGSPDGYAEEALAEADDQEEVARGLQLEFANDFPID